MVYDSLTRREYPENEDREFQWDGSLRRRDLVQLDPATRQAVLAARRAQHELELAACREQGYRHDIFDQGHHA